MKNRLCVCDVCFLLEGDITEKECYFCKTCGAWICQRCLPDYPRRAVAMAKTVFSFALESTSKGLDDWREKDKEKK